MRFKLTIRGDDTELRGYMDMGTTDTLAAFANAVEPYGLVIASAVEDDYNPFGITEPEHPPTPEASREVIRGILQLLSPSDAEDYLAQLHYGQAVVIRGERYRADQAEAELRDRELHHFEVEQENERLREDARNQFETAERIRRERDKFWETLGKIKDIRANFPEKCEVHDEDDITCGWKSMIAGIDKVLADD